MKTVKYILVILSILFGVIVICGFILILIEISNYSLSFTAEGFAFFVSKFSPLKEPLTVTIALLSTYFILFQVENITKSNKRTNDILENEIKSKTLEQSKFFYADLQPFIRETYVFIENQNDFLLNQEWNYDEFSWQHVNEQHDDWQPRYDDLSQRLKDKLIEILNKFESLSAIILNGNIDTKLAFKLFGKPFIKQIEILYPFIAQARDRKNKPEDNYYSSLFVLYKKWKIE